MNSQVLSLVSNRVSLEFSARKWLKCDDDNNRTERISLGLHQFKNQNVKALTIYNLINPVSKGHQAFNYPTFTEDIQTEFLATMQRLTFAVHRKYLHRIPIGEKDSEVISLP